MADSCPCTLLELRLKIKSHQVPGSLLSRLKKLSIQDFTQIRSRYFKYVYFCVLLVFFLILHVVTCVSEVVLIDPILEINRCRILKKTEQEKFETDLDLLQ